jgi:hypothetical protein
LRAEVLTGAATGANAEAEPTRAEIRTGARVNFIFGFYVTIEGSF